ncbi:MAG: hypothetical protein ABL866_06295 [Devosia sp.]
MPRLLNIVRAAFAVLAMTLSATLSVSPAYAGPTETAFLQSFAGTWSGSANMTGADTGKVTCKLVYKTSGAKVNFSGRCGVAGEGSQSFSGSMSYNDKAKRYESKSNGKIAVGTKRGDALLFVNASKTPQGKVSSTISLSPGALTMDTTFTDKDGATSSVHLVLSKS